MRIVIWTCVLASSLLGTGCLNQMRTSNWMGGQPVVPPAPKPPTARPEQGPPRPVTPEQVTPANARLMEEALSREMALEARPPAPPGY